MSALNVFVLGQEAHIVTDGAASTFGVLTHFMNKAFAMPQLGLAAGLRGNVALLNRVRFALSKYGSQEAALSGLPDQLRRSFGLGARLFPALYGFDIGVIGHADGKAFARLLSSIERPGQPAFSWLDVSGLWASPSIEGDELATIGRQLAQNLDAAAIALVDSQRLANVVSVGGFVQITSATAKGITTRHLKAYPDMRLKKIDASAGVLERSAMPPIVGDYRLI